MINATKTYVYRFENEHVLDLVLHKHNDSRVFISIFIILPLLESVKCKPDVLLLVMFLL